MESNSRKQNHTDQCYVCDCPNNNADVLRDRSVVLDVTNLGISIPTGLRLITVFKQRNNLNSAWQDTYLCMLLGPAYCSSL